MGIYNDDDARVVIEANVAGNELLVFSHWMDIDDAYADRTRIMNRAKKMLNNTFSDWTNPQVIRARVVDAYEFERKYGYLGLEDVMFVD